MAQITTNDGNSYADMQTAAQEAQNINNERLKNVALERQDQGNIAANMQVMAEAGGILANDVGPSTASTLSKYGYQQPKVQRTQGRDVKIKPNNITIINNNTTTTTNNITGGGSKSDDGGQAKFKTWVSNSFARQKEESARREKEYNKREWSLSKTANKMLRKMESASKEVANTFNAKVIGTTVGSQMKMLLMVFGVRFLAKNWTAILDVASHIYTKVANFVAFLGIGEDGAKQRRAGTDLSGRIVTIFGGDPKSSDRSKSTIIGLFGTIFDKFRNHVKKWFEGQMALRGEAMKNISFPTIDFSTDNSGGWLDSQISGLLNGLGNIFSKTFSGVTEYLGNILVALADPKAGAVRGLQSNISNQSLSGAKSQRWLEAQQGGPSEFTNDSRDSSLNWGDYALQGSVNGKRKYSLNTNAVDGSGELRNLVGASISQGRDLLGAVRMSQQYGYVDTPRVVAGLERLYNASKSGGYGAVIDEETLKGLFGPRAQSLISSGAIEEKYYKYVRNSSSSEKQAEEQSYAVDVYGSDDALSGLVSGAWNGASGEIIDAVTGGEVSGGDVGLARAGVKVTAKVAGKATPWGWVDTGLGALYGLGKGIYQSSKRSDEVRSNEAILVPEDDPRPEVKVEGQLQGRQKRYRLTPEALEELGRTSFGLQAGQGFTAENYDVILPAAENWLINKAGGEATVNRAWQVNGSKSKMFEGRSQRFDWRSSLDGIRRISEIEKQNRIDLENDEWSQWKAQTAANLTNVYNGIAEDVNEAIDGGIHFVTQTIPNYLNGSSENPSDSDQELQLWNGIASGARPSPSEGSYPTIMDARACLEFLHMFPYTPAARSIKATKSFGSKGRGTGPTQSGNLCSTFTKLAALYGMGCFTWEQACACKTTKDLGKLTPHMNANGADTNNWVARGGNGHGYRCMKTWRGQPGVSMTIDKLAKSGQFNPTDTFRVCNEGGNTSKSHVFMWGGDRWISDYLQSTGKPPSSVKRQDADWYRFAGQVINMPSNFNFNTNMISAGFDESSNNFIGNYNYGPSNFNTGTQSPGGGNLGMGSVPANVPIIQSRGEFFNMHKQRWQNFLINSGMSAEDADRISTFYAAQDGFESAGGTNRGARELNNWGGMMHGGKQIAYNSFEDYAAAKHKMMSTRFSYALGAQNMEEYVTMLHDPNQKFLYNVAKGYDHKTKAGSDLQWQAARNYLAGMQSYAASGANYGYLGNAIGEDSTFQLLPYLDVPQVDVKAMQDNLKRNDIWKKLSVMNNYGGFSGIDDFNKWYGDKKEYQKNRIDTTVSHITPAVMENIQSLMGDGVSMTDVLNTLILENGDSWLNTLNGWIRGTIYDNAMKSSTTRYKNHDYIKKLNSVNGKIEGNNYITKRLAYSILGGGNGFKDEDGNTYNFNDNYAIDHDLIDSYKTRQIGTGKALEILQQEVLKGNKDIIGKAEDGTYKNKYFNDKLGASFLFGEDFVGAVDRLEELNKKWEDNRFLSVEEDEERRRLKSKQDTMMNVTHTYLDKAGDMEEGERKIAFGTAKKYTEMKDKLYDLQSQEDELNSQFMAEFGSIVQQKGIQKGSKEWNETYAKVRSQFTDQFDAIKKQRDAISDGLMEFSEFMDDQTKALFNKSLAEKVKASSEEISKRFQELIAEEREGGPLSYLEAFEQMTKEFGEGFLEKVISQLDVTDDVKAAVSGKYDEIKQKWLNKDPDVKDLEASLAKANSMADLELVFQGIRGAWNFALGIDAIRKQLGVNKEVNKVPITNLLTRAEQKWDDAQQFAGLGRPFGTSASGRWWYFTNQEDHKNYRANLEIYNKDTTGGYLPAGMAGISARYNSSAFKSSHAYQSAVLNKVSSSPIADDGEWRYRKGNVQDLETGKYTDSAAAAYKDNGNKIPSSGKAEGGFTTPGGKYDIAGILADGENVHASEWVAPAWMVRDPAYRPLINMMEKSRVAKNAGIEVASSSTKGIESSSEVSAKLDQLIEVVSKGNEYTALNVRATSEGLNNVGTIIANKPVSSNNSPRTRSVKSLTS